MPIFRGGGAPREFRRRVKGTVLAWSEASLEGRPGYLAGTRTALVWLGEVEVEIPWEQVRSADWDRDGGRLKVIQLSNFGTPHARYEFTVEDPGRLPELVRERVTASVVLQRAVTLGGAGTSRVIARRSPDGGEVHWMVEYAEGLDPSDPRVIERTEDALADARAELAHPDG